MRKHPGMNPQSENRTFEILFRTEASFAYARTRYARVTRARARAPCIALTLLTFIQGSSRHRETWYASLRRSATKKR